tara:strand:+ start:823 stop:1020 length:198 start_codon:yes stop_codon:yes gene_type:complete
MTNLDTLKKNQKKLATITKITLNENGSQLWKKKSEVKFDLTNKENKALTKKPSGAFKAKSNVLTK